MSASDTKYNMVKSLEFDQYSRQLIVSNLIEKCIRPLAKKTKLKILDIGGHNGKTTEFQPDDTVIILDRQQQAYHNYIEGDAACMSFSDDEFDVVCSFDTLEHIPRERRLGFLDEALRVSKSGVFLTVPLEDKGVVSAAEVQLNQFYREIFGTDHVWLKEHIDYKIPTKQEIMNLVKDAGAQATTVASNRLGDWKLMQALIFASSGNVRMSGPVRGINVWYNQNALALDEGIDVGYRGIFFVSRNKDYLSKVDEAMRPTTIKPRAKKYVSINSGTFEQFMKTFAEISKDYALMSEENATHNRRFEVLRDDNFKLSHQMLDLQQSLSWKLTMPLRVAKAKIKIVLARGGDEKS